MLNELPAEVITRIIRHVVEHDEVEWQHGGYFGWDSHEAAAPLTTVCRVLHKPATDLLYGSIFLQGLRSAKKLSDTLQARPDLASKVVSIVIGVGKALEASDDGSEGQVEASLALLDTIEKCENIRRFQARPLHVAAASRLSQALARLQLGTLAVVSRIVSPPPSWSYGMYDRLDWSAMLKTLRQVSIDCSASYSAPWALGYSPSQLTHLSVQNDAHDSTFFGLIDSASATLVDLRVYTEQARPRERLIDALSRLSNLRNLTYLSNVPIYSFDSNPTTSDEPSSSSSDSSTSPRPVVEAALPKSVSLATLHVSSTDVSPAVLRVVPRTLTRLTIQSFSPLGPFKYDPAFVDDVRDESVAVGLRSLSIIDTRSRWTESQLGQLARACEGRGIVFDFLPDSDGESSGGTRYFGSAASGSGENLTASTGPGSSADG